MRSTQKKAAAPPTSTSWETDEAAPFPRGGGSALTPLEHRAITERAKEDALFEAREMTSAPAESSAVDPERTAMSSGEDLIRAHNLGRRQLVPGVRMLCAVEDVSSDRLLVQLPCRLVGRVDRAEVSDELSAALDDGKLQSPPDLRRLFTVGEVLCAAVLSSTSTSTKGQQGHLQQAPPVEMSLRLSLVQKAPLAATPRLRAGFPVWATFRSSEEYGFVVDTAAPGGGFMQRASWKASAEPAKWRPHLCAVSAGGLQHARKPLQLAALGVHGSTLDAKVRSIPQETALKFEALLPGMIVDAKVGGILADGVRLVFGGYFEGTAHCEAFGFASASWPKRLAPGTNVTARILWVHTSTKAVGLGLSPHLIGNVQYTPPLPLAATLKASYEIVLKSGVLVTVDAGDADAPSTQGKGGAQPISGWLGKSAVVDLKERQTSADALKRLKAGGGASGVVVGVRYLEGLLDVSTRASAIGEHWMT